MISTARHATTGAVREYGTRLLRTTIHAADDGFVWCRAPGPDAPEPFAPLPPGGSLLSPSSTAAVRLVLGTPQGEGRRYAVAGDQSVAALMLQAVFEPEFDRHLRGLGQTLRRIHALPPSCLAAPTGPRPLRRLTAWLRGQAATPGARASRSQLLPLTGPRRWAEMEHWLTGPATGTGVAHGAPSLGSLTLDGSGSGAALLAGEDLGVAPWSYDVGWVLGELAELAWQMGWRTELQTRLFTAFLEGYGRPITTEVHRWMTVRTLLHIHDFTAYTEGWGAELPRYSRFLNYLLDATVGGDRG